MKRILVLLLVAMTTSLHGFAIVRSQQVMKEIANRQLQQMGINGMVTLATETNTYAIYRSAMQGFVVVGKTSEGRAVLGYSKTNFDAKHLPCGLKWWLKATDKALQQQHYSADEQPGFTVVDNLLQTKWGQDMPYNYYCPTVKGEHVPCGCVATAMSQVLRYYAYPTHAEGPGRYTTEIYNETLNAYSSKTVVENIKSDYDWDNIPYDPRAADVTEKQQQNIGQLVYDCGRAVNMNYASDGSGAYSHVAAAALATVFGYNEDATHYVLRDFYSDSEWMNIVYTELAEGRPIIMGASDDAGNGGHEFLLTGVDANGMIYVNWGWDGVCDGYYAIDKLNPDNSFAFNSGQDIITRLIPQKEAVTGMPFESHMGCTSSLSGLFITPEGQLSVSNINLFNTGHLDFDGTVGVLLENTAEGSTEKQYFEYVNINMAHYAQYNGSARQTYDLSGLTAGTYRVRLVAKDVKDADYRPVRGLGGKFYERLLTKSADGTCELAEQTTDIHQAKVATDTSVRYYDMQGRSVSANHRGLTIIRQNGKTRKVMR